MSFGYLLYLTSFPGYCGENDDTGGGLTAYPRRHIMNVSLLHRRLRQPRQGAVEKSSRVCQLSTSNPSSDARNSAGENGDLLTLVQSPTLDDRLKRCHP